MTTTTKEKRRWLASYMNGNIRVRIYPDGTKTRTWREETTPQPAFPESIDMKITNSCDAGCPFCHESAVPNGKHATTRDIQNLIRGLPYGVEVAIGGGNPLDHPCLEVLLRYLSSNLIVNLTVNAKHLEQPVQHNGFTIAALRNAGFLHGLGISYAEEFEEQINTYANENTVIHFIAGIDKPSQAAKMLEQGRKILILGYKSFGRGVNPSEDVQQSLLHWKAKLPALLSISRSVVAFDNLALNQLDAKQILTEGTWNRLYMGDDGKFTMYIDAAAMQYAASSTSERFTIRHRMSIKQCFQELQHERERKEKEQWEKEQGD